MAAEAVSNVRAFLLVLRHRSLGTFSIWWMAANKRWSSATESTGVESRRLYVTKADNEAAPSQLTVVQNWFEELRRRVPTN